ncbi:Lrp/AsnC family transcriptional regulator [Candidatus Woesearchaeota archaeon]|nr:Lrp/AsnC family transcriptional regulator [Candidatus Woesearchaeota archaeon]
MELSDKDKKLIALLRNNCRQKLTRLSKETRIPVKLIQNKIQNYEEKFIDKHATLLQFEKLGYLTRVNITIAVDALSKEEMEKYLIRNPNVNNLYQINNGYDFLIEAILKNDEHLDKFIEDLEKLFNIKRKEFQYILRDIKRENFMANKHIPIN